MRFTAAGIWWSPRRVPSSTTPEHWVPLARWLHGMPQRVFVSDPFVPLPPSGSASILRGWRIRKEESPATSSSVPPCSVPCGGRGVHEEEAVRFDVLPEERQDPLDPRGNRRWRKKSCWKRCPSDPSDGELLAESESTTSQQQGSRRPSEGKTQGSFARFEVATPKTVAGSTGGKKPWSRTILGWRTARRQKSWRRRTATGEEKLRRVQHHGRWNLGSEGKPDEWRRLWNVMNPTIGSGAQ